MSYTQLHKNRFALLTGLAIVLAFNSTAVMAHSKLVTPSARTSSDPVTQDLLISGGLENPAPCGSIELIPAGEPTATWPPGSDQNIIIDHRVNHGIENLQFFVSYDQGASFNELQSPSQPEVGFISYIPGGLTAPAGTGIRSVRVKAPGNTAASVILRFTDGTYFSCADIKVSVIQDDLIIQDSFEGQD